MKRGVQQHHSTHKQNSIWKKKHFNVNNYVIIYIDRHLTGAFYRQVLNKLHYC